MLINELNAAKAKAQELQRALESCNHEFITTPMALGSHAFLNDFGQPDGGCYVAEQWRKCERCGVSQRRISFRPNDGWTEWKDAN